MGNTSSCANEPRSIGDGHVAVVRGVIGGGDDQSSAKKAPSIYTRTGDRGMTALLSGRRVSKACVSVSAYGVVDELMANVAHLFDRLSAMPSEDSEDDLLMDAQLDVLNTAGAHLFLISSWLAHDGSRIKLDELPEGAITELEKNIDAMTARLPTLTNFIRQSGHPCISLAHITRAICRRAERKIVKLDQVEPTAPNIITYVNRLSDYLFTLARFIAHWLGVSEHIL